MPEVLPLKASSSAAARFGLLYCYWQTKDGVGAKSCPSAATTSVLEHKEDFSWAGQNTAIFTFFRTKPSSLFLFSSESSSCEHTQGAVIGSVFCCWLFF